MRPTYLPTLLMLAACDFDYVVVEIESVDVCLKNYVAEVPANADGEIRVTLSRESEEQPEMVDEAHEALDLPDGWEVTQVTLQNVTLRVTEGTTDLGFMNRLQVEMQTIDPAASLPPVQLIDFVHSTNTNTNYITSAGADTMVLEGDPNLNVDRYFDTDALQIDMVVEGQMPKVDWAMTVEPCFTFAAEYADQI